jgi:hypothetical protein
MLSQSRRRGGACSAHRLLKVGADLFPSLKILATGSSTLAASRKFRDTLTGRKHSVHLVPVLFEELPAFGGVALAKRLLHGGLPEVLLADTRQPAFYREWTDSFFARDVQRLFGFRDVNRFSAFFEYVCRRSGGQLEIATAARDLAISRPTVESHLRALEITHAATSVRPFFGSGRHEIVKAPKVYAFDTGFVSWARGWDPLRPDNSYPQGLNFVVSPAGDPAHVRRFGALEVRVVTPTGLGLHDVGDSETSAILARIVAAGSHGRNPRPLGSRQPAVHGQPLLAEDTRTCSSTRCCSSSPAGKIHSSLRRFVQYNGAGARLGKDVRSHHARSECAGRAGDNPRPSHLGRARRQSRCQWHDPSTNRAGIA